VPGIGVIPRGRAILLRRRSCFRGIQRSSCCCVWLTVLFRAFAGGKLLIGVKDYREAEGKRKSGYGLYALNAADGTLAWNLRTDKHIYVPPVVVGDVVLLAADDRRLRALNLADGSELWQVVLPEKLRAGPLVIEDRVVVGNYLGRLQHLCVIRTVYVLYYRNVIFEAVCTAYRRVDAPVALEAHNYELPYSS